MFIVDAHQNIAPSAQQFGRDYTRWAWLQRQREAVPDLPATTSLRDNLIGRVALVFASLRVIPAAAASSPQQPIAYHSAAEARRLAGWQMDYYKRLADEEPRIQLVQTQSDLQQVLESWARAKAIPEHIHGIVPLLAGAEPIAEPRQFEEWAEQGVRIVAPASHPNRYCAAGELTRLGYELLEVLASHRSLLDIAAMPERASQQALENYAGAVIASHTSPRHFYDSPHSLSDAAIRQLAERGGVMGITLHSRFLKKDWHPADPKRRVRLSHWVDAVDYVCQLTGSVEHVGLGSDIDGGYAYRSLPADVDTASDLWLLKARLQERGFTDDNAEAILSGNMLRQLRGALPDG